MIKQPIKRSERHFSIDPGKGKKMAGCPYSLFEDGHDVQNFIIPPKGFKFIGFKCITLPDNSIYDGKLIAQYEKKTISEQIISNLKYIVIGVIALIIISILIVLASSKSSVSKPKTAKKQRIEKTAASSQNTMKQEIAVSESKTVDFISEETASSENTIDVSPIGEPTADILNEMFKQEFWDLIHQGTKNINLYSELYNKYKGKQILNEEFEYLKQTILKNWKSFKKWNSKLTRIPSSELENIDTIDELTKRLKGK